MNGYTTINLNGVQTGLKFAFPAMRMFAEALEKKPDLYILDGEKADFTLEGLAKFIQCGYVNNCIIKEVEPSLTYEDFFNYAEGAQTSETRAQEIAKVFECYGQTIYAKKLAELGEEKKSVIGTI